MENILLQEPYIKRLEQDLSQNKLSHAYLLLSPDKIFNEIVATEIASLILCENKSACENCASCKMMIAKTQPDFIVFPNDKNFLVEDANLVIEKATQRPTLGDVKVIFIKNIDEATIQAQNKILKTLEEPSKSVVFILTATNENKILPTVVSRTRREYLTPLEKEKIQDLIKNPPLLLLDLIEKKNYIGNELIQAVDNCEGWIGKALEILSIESFKEQKLLARKILVEFTSSKQLSSISAQILAFKEDLSKFFYLLENEFKNTLKETTNEQQLQGTLEIINAINTFNLAYTTNVSPSLVIDNLLMKILEIKYNYQMN